MPTNFSICSLFLLGSIPGYAQRECACVVHWPVGMLQAPLQTPFLSLVDHCCMPQAGALALRLSASAKGAPLEPSICRLGSIRTLCARRFALQAVDLAVQVVQKGLPGCQGLLRKAELLLGAVVLPFQVHHLQHQQLA